MLNTQNLNQNDYESLRFELINQLEASNNLDTLLRPIIDDRGIPTIGIGLNLRNQASRNIVFNVLGINPNNSNDAQFSIQLINVINQIWLDGQEAQLRAALDNVMQNRATALGGRQTFAFLNRNESENAFAQRVTNIDEPIISSRLQNFSNSLERATLVSMVFNAPVLLGSGLIRAINNSDRSEAWYEIRYNSGGGNGRIKRQLIESKVFGIYDNSNPNSSFRPSETDALQVFRMFNKHESDIIADENIFQNNSRGYQAANQDLIAINNRASTVNLNRIQSAKQEFAPAKAVLIDNFATLPSDVRSELRVSSFFAANPNSFLLKSSEIDGVFVASATASSGNGEVAAHTVDRTGRETRNNRIYSGQDDLIFGGIDSGTTSGGNDVLVGADGNDLFIGGLGNDIHDGGDGEDAVSYLRSPSAVTINLESNSGNGGHATGDTYQSIENIIGSSFNDVLTGNSQANTLIGLEGEDRINGSNGNDIILGNGGKDILNGDEGDDILNGGEKNDELDGGDGNDIAVFSDFIKNYDVLTLDNKTFTVKPKQDTILDGEDTLKNIERIQFRDAILSLPDLEVEPFLIDINLLGNGIEPTMAQVQTDFNERILLALGLNNRTTANSTTSFTQAKTLALNSPNNSPGLPFFGDVLVQTDAGSFLNDFGKKVNEELNQKFTDRLVPPDRVQSSLFEVLSPIGILKDANSDGIIKQDDIIFTRNGSKFQFNFTLGGKNFFDISLPSQIGLPQLGLNLGEDAEAGVDLDYTFNFGFGIDTVTNEFFFDTSPTEDLSISLKPTLPKAEATLGFLQIDAKDNGTNLNFSIDLDDGEDGDNRLTPSELSNLRLTPEGTADINLRFDASLADSSVLPSISSDFKLHWDFVEDATAPTVNFENVELKLGTFFQNFASPVFKQLQKIIEPIQPLIDVLDKQVPVLDTFGRNFLDVTGSETDAPDGKVTLLDLVKLKEPDAKLDYIRAAKQVSEFIQTVSELSKTDATIKLGQFDFGSENIASSSFDLSAIDLEETSEEEDVVAQLQDFIPEPPESPESPEPSEPSEPSALEKFIKNITTPSGPQFPILTDPTQAFKLILGQPAELFTYNVPELRFDFGFEQFFPVLGPLGAQIEGDLGARVKLALGFDTYGLAETGNPLDGFYISNKPDPSGPGGLQKPTQDPTKGRESGAELFAELNASAAFNGGIVRGGVGGGILGTLTLLLNDLNKDGDPTKVHLNEFDPSCIFDPVTGNLSASLNAFIKIGFGFLSYTKRFTLAKTTLLDFAIGCNSEQRNDPLRNNGLATLLMEADSQFGLTEGDLRLNMGADFAKERLIGGQLGTDGAEVFAVNYVSGTANNATLSVSTSDVTREYSNASRIVAFAGKEDDSIVIADEVFTPASLEGEEGNDRIYGGSGNDTLKGGTGDDALFGGNGNDELLGGDGDDNLEGGAGADVIDGGANTDEGGDAVSYKDSPTGVSFVLDPSGSGFFLGSGGEAQGDKLKNIEQLEGSNFNDVLLGNNSSRNTLEGLKGNDSLKGGKEKDILLGGEGADTLDGGEDRDWTGYITSTAGVYIDLATGRATGGEAQGDKLISIEDVKGSTYNDILIGSAADNYLDGFTGDDRIIGGGGGDILDGGDNGKDWVSYETSPSGVNVSLKTGNGSGGDAQGDELVKAKDSEGKDTAYNSFENLEGSSFNDVLEGDIGDNTLKGLENDDTLRGDAGNDTLIGGAGADFLDGGAGIDWADYSASATAVTINLQVGVGSGGDAQGDTFALVNGKSTVENLLGTNVADTLLGDDGDNVIDPGLSNSQNNEFDVVYGGNGNDLLTLDYSSNDDNGTGIFGGFTGSYIGFGPGLGFFRYTNDGSRFLDAVAFETIERLDIIGTKKADQIFGGANDDTLLPGAGDDTIYGGLGSNTILADDGNDVVVDQNDANGKLNGSPNANTFINLDGGRGIDTLSIDLSFVYDDIQIESFNPFQENTNQQLWLYNAGNISNFEVFKDIKTGDGNDKLTQLGKVNNNYQTGYGDDVVNPGIGFDTVDGGYTDGDGNYDDLDLLILDYSVEDTGTGILAEIKGPYFGTFTATQGGRFYRNVSETNSTLLDEVVFENFEHFDITGTSKSDRLIGGDGTDTLRGQDGNDTVYSGLGDDFIAGGDGDDRLADGDDFPAREFPSYYSSGNDVFQGGNGNDTLFGLANDDRLFGEAGDDFLFGGENNDTLDGGDGNDVLRGVERLFSKGDQDVLTGGAGADKFQLGDESVVDYDDGDDYQPGTEDFARITDFNSSEGDIIQLHGSAYDYSLVTTPNSIEIHWLGSELIAIVEGTSELNLSSNYFEFLGNVG